MPGKLLCTLYCMHNKCIHISVLNRSMCSNDESDGVRDLLQEYFEPLAESYLAIVENQPKEFYGLRDFYR